MVRDGTKLLFSPPTAPPLMNKVVFELKYPSAKERSAIRLVYFCADGKFPYSTGESVHPSSWPNSIPKGTSAVLRRIETHIEELADSLKIRNERLTKAVLRASLDKLLHKDPAGDGTNLFDAMTGVIDRMENGKILTPKTKKRYSKGSIKTFRFTVEFLRKFNPAMTLNGITIDTYNRFIKYCHDLDYSTNYIGSQIKNWKTLGKAVGGNPVFSNPEFVKIQELTDDIYLDEKELGSMYRLKLAGIRELIRDWYIIASYTGLRVSDITLLDKRNYSKGFITIANEKTDFKVVIPVHSCVKAILDKYKGFPPAVRSDQINEQIKPIARQAGINDKVLFTITKGGKRVDQYLEKWEMVSCHTARRCFITNLREAGVPDAVVMKLTGIKSAQTLQRYTKLTPEKAGKIAAGLKFFK
jgi:integrase